MSDGKVVSLTKKLNGYAVYFLFINLYKIFKVDISQIIDCNLLKLSFISNFHIKEYVVFSETLFDNLKYGCVIKTTKNV